MSIKEFWSKHSDTVLTGVGVASIFSTGIGAACATPGFLEELREQEDPTIWDRIRIGFKHYWAPAANAILGGTAMIAATKINHAERAALAGLVTIGQVKLNEYQQQIIEEFGDAAKKKMDEHLAAKHVAANPPTPSNVIITSEDANVTFYDCLTGRYFKSTMHRVQDAINKLNSMLLVDHSVDVAEFHRMIGLPDSVVADHLYFTQEHPIDVDFSAAMSPDGAYAVIEMSYLPELLSRVY